MRDGKSSEATFYEYNLVNVDILKVGHHSSKKIAPLRDLLNKSENISSLQDRIIYMVTPTRTLERLENSQILITALDGNGILQSFSILLTAR